MRLEVVQVNVLALESLQRIALLCNGESILAADLLWEEAAPLLADELASGTL